MEHLKVYFGRYSINNIAVNVHKYLRVSLRICLVMKSKDLVERHLTISAPVLPENLHRGKQCLPRELHLQGHWAHMDSEKNCLVVTASSWLQGNLGRQVLRRGKHCLWREIGRKCVGKWGASAHLTQLQQSALWHPSALCAALSEQFGRSLGTKFVKLCSTDKHAISKVLCRFLGVLKKELVGLNINKKFFNSKYLQFWWLSTENSCWEPSKYSGTQNYHPYLK